jgi:hypothetical protein
MTPTDKPLEFKLLQFPVRLAFSMIINKLQGQLKQVYGLNFENSCFSHGELCVAYSRVKLCTHHKRKNKKYCIIHIHFNK